MSIVKEDELSEDSKLVDRNNISKTYGVDIIENKSSRTLWQKFKDSRPFLVEIPVFLFFFAYKAALPLKEQLVYALVQTRYSDQTSKQGDLSQKTLACQALLNESLQVDQYDAALESLIQQESSDLLSLLNLVRNVPALFTTLFICSYTDFAGRKIGLILPCLGGALKTFIFLVMLYSQTTNYEAPLYVGEIVEGIGGSIMTAQSCAVAYIADIVPADSRSFRFTLIQALHFVGTALGNLLIGLLINSTGYLVSLWLLVGCYLLGLFYTICLLPESLPSLPQKTISLWEILKQTVSVFRIYTSSARPVLDQIKLFLMLFTTISENLGLLGRNDVDVLYMLGIPFCWSSVIIGYFQAVRYFAKAVVVTIGVRVMVNCLPDAIIGFIGSTIGIAGNLLMAFAQNSAQLWGVAGLNAPSGIVLPMVQAVMSKIVSTEEQGALFASLGVVEAASDMVAGTLMDVIYADTVSTFPGAVFVVIAGLFVISSLCFLAVAIIDRCRGPPVTT